jgi:dihydroorotate dehydrogenase electron transfer subunit
VKEEIIRYFDLIRFIYLKSKSESENIDKLINKTFSILPRIYKSEFANYKHDKRFRAAINKRQINTKFYSTFCFNLLELLTNRLGLKIGDINEKFFNTKFLSLKVKDQFGIILDKTIRDNCAFIIKNKETNLIFSFGHQSENKLKDLSNYIYSIDHNRYENIHVIIFKNSEELDQARKVSKSHIYKRSFFTSFDEICSKVKKIDKDSYNKIFSVNADFGRNKLKIKNIASLHNIIIEDNIPVGLEKSNLYKLTFKSEYPIDIYPSQFVMIDTLGERNKYRSTSYEPKSLSSISGVKPNIYNDLDIKRFSFLKRPFGIYRTYYENFTYDCSSKLNLEKELAAILYTIKPNKFEILYKVLETGTGTNELTKLIHGDKVEILAPLGKIFDLREILNEAIDEIHIVGGGVGIAPLVYLVQMLRFFNIKVKAFIGIENYGSLCYDDAGVDSQSFTGTGRNAKIYIDDLKYLGLSETSDIYLSLLSDGNEATMIDIKHVFKGCFITEPYSKYLKKHNDLKILTFTCGPLPMMHKVHNLTLQYNIKSYVLMEKRMACGIGVCFSCVCRTIENGVNHYSRICIDGPIIESNKINWNEEQS